MKILLLCLLFISSIYTHVDEGTLASLRNLDHWNTFRIVLSHTNDECFFVETKLNDTIHVIYQVVKGFDNYVRATITDPVSKLVFTQVAEPFGWYSEEHTNLPGTYQICFKNERYFTGKILYIAVLAVHIDHVLESAAKAYLKERNNETVIMDEFSKKATKTLNDVSRALYQLTVYQTITRIRHAHDMSYAEANSNYIQKWALYQIATMILCSMIQVFSIRQLFKPIKSTKTSSSKKSNTIFSPQPSHSFIVTN